MRNKFIKLIATFFFTGYLPFVPGTWGSLGAVGVYLLIRHDIYLFLAVFTALFFLGLYTAGKAEDAFGKKDDRRIVIDEVCGMLLVFLLIHPYGFNTRYLVIAFVLFRLFDFLKPLPARKLEKLPRSWGIMADDIVAALYSYVVISVLMCFMRYFL